MNSPTICASCNRALESQHFRKGRTTCMACKAKQLEERISRSSENYLRNLHSQSKSAVKCGKRADHVEWHIEPEDLVALWEKQKGKCAVSGVFLTHHKDGSGRKDYNASIDRISCERGYTPQNVQLVAYRINIMKHTLSEDMFYWWIKTINDFSCD
jgi:hypothetical protein